MIKQAFAFLLLTCLVAALPAAAQGDQTPTIRDKNGCQIYNPNPQAEETVTWTGGCRDGFADGKGVLEWFIGGQLEERYEGTMVGGWAEGVGTFTSRQGVRYQGEWKKSLQDGKGVSQSADGSRYEGQWRAGKPHGRGTYVSPNGESIEGEWENGELKAGSSSRRI